MKKLILCLIFLFSFVGFSHAADQCNGDFDRDGDVDSTDLSSMAEDFGKTDCSIESVLVITCDGTLSPMGRWCDMGDGTVKDMTTGLLWLQQVHCSGLRNWSDAVLQFASIDVRSGQCGLTDGSGLGDWRLPSFDESLHITDSTIPESIICDNPEHCEKYFFNMTFLPFPHLQFWSSAIGNLPGDKAYVFAVDGSWMVSYPKTFLFAVWPVRTAR